MRQLVHGIDEEAAGEHEQDRSRKIDRDIFGLCPAFLQQFPREIRAPESYRQIEIKNPAPADRIDQKTAKRRTGKKADVKRHRRKSHSLAALLGGKRDRGNRSTIGGNHRAADGLQAAKQNYLPCGLRCAAQRGAQAEDQKTASIEAAPPEEVTQTADRDDGADQEQIVNQQDSLNRRQTGVKRLGQRG